jgi:glycerophosphoryl diester phosphodiesterase
MTVLDILDQGINACFACYPRKKPDFNNAQKACLIAHRGAHGYYTDCIENTCDAFTYALTLGCWGIELDIHLTADNILVVNHDNTLKRLWHQPATINAISFKTLRQLAPNVPTLLEVVERYSHQLHLFIELKAPFYGANELAVVLQSLIAGRDYHLLSLDEEVFSMLKQFPRSAMLLVANYNNVAQFCHRSLEMAYGGVLGHYCLLTNFFVSQLKMAHQQIGVGFVNSKYSLYRELNRGINWIFSNDVAKVSQYLQALR